MNYRLSAFLIPSLFLALQTGCGIAGAASGGQGKASGGMKEGAAIAANAGAVCDKSDPDNICLGLKYVVYSDPEGAPLVKPEDVGKIVGKINNLFAQCKINFQVDEYVPAAVRDFALNFRPTDNQELESIRKTFLDDKTLLVVTTGTWDRSGSLGSTGANAWTQLPGDDPYGVVLEKPVGTFANIIAHELGHYLDLLHQDDTSNLMNPVIYDDSSQLSADQCETARSTAKTYWQNMLR